MSGPASNGGGQITAGGVSAPAPAIQGTPAQDWRGRGAPARSQPINRLDWSGVGKPPPPETFSQWLKRILRCWWADIGNQVEDLLIVWRDQLIGAVRDLASRGSGGSVGPDGAGR